MSHPAASTSQPDPELFERLRTARQRLVPDFGSDGQRRLAGAHVLVVGVGGLGCPVVQQLAAAGVGTLTLIDDDTVSVNNLHRQILFGAEDVGARKVDVAARRARALQPGIAVRRLPHPLDKDNAVELCAEADLVIDGSDTFATKFLVADACEVTSTPLVWGTVLGLRGDCALWHSGDGTPDGRGVGLRDLFPEAPVSTDTCSTAGVLGATAAVVGDLMATTAIGWLAAIPTVVPGRVVSFESFPPALRTMTVAAHPARALVADVQPADGAPAAAGNAVVAPDGAERGIVDAVAAGEALLLDIREPEELDLARLPEFLEDSPARLWMAWHIIADEEMVRATLTRLSHRQPECRDVAVVCASGGRSQGFALRFRQIAGELGLRLHNVPGGASALEGLQPRSRA